MSRDSRTSPRGFTLIEIGMVLLVMVLLMGIAIPTLENVMGAKARAEVSKLAANIRATRGHAAVAGETCRMVFCIKDCGSKKEGQKQPDDSYTVECTKGDVPMQREDVRNGQMEQPDDLDDFSRSDDSQKERLALMKKNAFTPSPVLPVQRLAGVHLATVWTAHQTEKYDKGRAYLYFFPSGMTELANIQLQDGDDWYTVQVSPLSGKIKVVGSKVDLPDQRDDDEDF